MKISQEVIFPFPDFAKCDIAYPSGYVHYERSSYKHWQLLQPGEVEFQHCILIPNCNNCNHMFILYCSTVNMENCLYLHHCLILQLFSHHVHANTRFAVTASMHTHWHHRSFVFRLHHHFPDDSSLQLCWVLLFSTLAWNSNGSTGSVCDAPLHPEMEECIVSDCQCGSGVLCMQMCVCN